MHKCVRQLHVIVLVQQCRELQTMVALTDVVFDLADRTIEVPPRLRSLFIMFTCQRC